MPKVLRKIFILAILVGMLWPCSASQSAACLGYGSNGKDVILLQQRLQELHYEVGVIDGEFGRQTKLAVEQFQQRQGLKKTGFVDNDTWRKLALTEANYSKPVQAKVDHKIVSYSKIPVSTGYTENIVFEAKHYLGVPYVWGGQSPKGFDCSGFVQYVFQKNGITLPRTADLQYEKGLSVKKDNLQQGDVVFFTTYAAGPSHNGIYVGDGKFISATTSRGIAIDKIESDYWKTRYIGAKRINKI